MNDQWMAPSAKWRGEQEEAEQSGRSTGSLWTRVDWTSCGAGQQRAKRAESRAGSGRGQKVTTNTPTPAFTLVQSRLCGRLVSVDLSTKKTMTTTKSVHSLTNSPVFHCSLCRAEQWAVDEDENEDEEEEEEEEEQQQQQQQQQQQRKHHFNKLPH
ncbi:hypothetical protein T4A_117 [Trichinella pseudospiralis]|uniref:Uncharacterized protein n=1 Tax=Trichinella pseudospiralis TaxID=6337 RepID=A0A0V1DX73_TRIPS|nr:hypothetical protein T4A_117 [Trichinella pseudospiralis]